MRAGEHQQNFLFGLKGTGRRIGPCQVKTQRAVLAAMAVENHGDVGGMESRIHLGDQSREGMIPYQLVDHLKIVLGEMARDVHVKEPPNGRRRFRARAGCPIQGR